MAGLGDRRHLAWHYGRARVAVLATAQVILNGVAERAGARPGEAADERFADVGEPGVREVVPQVAEVGPGPVAAHGLPGRGGAGQRLFPG